MSIRNWLLGVLFVAALSVGHGRAQTVVTMSGDCTAAVSGAVTCNGRNPVTTIAASGASQALAFPAVGNITYDITLTANCTLTLTGGTAGQYQRVTLILRGGAGGFTATLPTPYNASTATSGVRWPNQTVPTPNTAAGAVNYFTFDTPDAGATVLGNY